jgi:protocatechuate 4,5-dioxygenase, alpha chain
MCNVSGSAYSGIQRHLTNAINRMCSSLAIDVNLSDFLANERAYCLRFGLNKEQREAVTRRDFLRLIDAGGHVTYLDNLAWVAGLGTLDTIIRRTGTSLDVLIAKLLRIEPR